MEALIQPAAFFTLNFLAIFFQLIFYTIFGWVICSWIIMFGGMRRDNSIFIFLSQIVQPVMAPFRWARVGMLDLSPIVAIFALQLIVEFLGKIIIQMSQSS